MGTEGYDFEILELAAVDCHANKRTILVPALQACGAGVDVQQTERLVILYLQYVRMPGDK